MVYSEFLFRINRPKDDTLKIWRYLDLPKFISLLQRKGLYFCNTLNFEDPYEGNLPKHYWEAIQNDRIAYLPKDMENYEAHRRLAVTSDKRNLDIIRQRFLVNCWHINNYESAAMWDLYSNRNFGLAIQSKVGKLKKSFNYSTPDVDIGEIEYMDYENDNLELKRNLILWPENSFIFKRLSFSHEKELRACIKIWDNDLPKEKLDKDITLPTVGKSIDMIKGKMPLKIDGEYVNVDLNQLIERIYIAPSAPEYYLDVVKSILDKYNVSSNLIIKSDLYHLK